MLRLQSRVGRNTKQKASSDSRPTMLCHRGWWDGGFSSVGKILFQRHCPSETSPPRTFSPECKCLALSHGIKRMSCGIPRVVHGALSCDGSLAQQMQASMHGFDRSENRFTVKSGSCLVDNARDTDDPLWRVTYGDSAAKLTCPRQTEYTKRRERAFINAYGGHGSIAAVLDVVGLVSTFSAPTQRAVTTSGARKLQKSNHDRNKHAECRRCS